MNKQFQLKSKTKQLILLTTLLCAIFPAVFILFSSTLRNHFKAQIENEASLVAKSNSVTIQSIDKSVASIHSILVEQLKNVGEILVTTSSPDNIKQNDVLSQYYLVDEINWFSSEGVILYSSKDYEGHSFDKTHAVWRILDNDYLDLYIEDIRKDKYTEEEFLLLYMRAPDNSVVQVGVLTTRIRDLTNEFSVDTLVSNNLDNDRIISAFVYAPYHIVQISNVYDNQTIEITQEQMDILLSRKDTTRELIIDGERALEVYTTLYDDEGRHTGSFFLAYSLEETESFVNRLSVFIFIFLLFITLLIIFFINIVFKQNRKIEQTIYTDPETNILNIEFVRQNYSELTKKKGTPNTTIALFLISDFKREQLLNNHDTMLARLNSLVDTLKHYSESKELYRYSEDVFVMISHSWSQERVIQSIHNVLDNHTSKFEVRTALIEHANDFDDVETLFDSYKAAIIQLRENDDATDLVMSDEIQAELLKGQTLERDMRLLSTEGFGNQLHVEFQPQIDTVTGKVIGYEALTRWIHPTYGYISPMLIFDIAQSTDYYNSLNQWVITQALEFIHKLNEAGYYEPIVSVNTPNSYILLPECVHSIRELLRIYNVSPSQLGFEVTETTFEDSTYRLKLRIQEFNELGITTYIDDYGSGYSSMVRLRDLDVSVLKIDKTFIDDINKDERFLNNILGIAKELNLNIVAEGAEHDYQIEWLNKHNCSVIQGFYFSKALKCDEAIEYIKTFKYEPSFHNKKSN